MNRTERNKRNGAASMLKAVMLAALALTAAPAEGFERTQSKSAALVTCQAGICAQVDVTQDATATRLYLLVFDTFSDAILIGPVEEAIDPAAFVINANSTAATLRVADAELAWTATADYEVLDVQQTYVQAGVRTRSEYRETLRPARVEGTVGPLSLSPGDPPGVLRLFTERSK